MRHQRSFNLRRPRSGGFTFTEVLFAVILLGIGFIMLAGIFPVAIQQTQTTAEETAASTMALRAMNQIAAIAKTTDFPHTNGNVDRVPDTMWTSLAGNMIGEKDARLAWVPLYRRNPADRYMQLIIVGIQAQHEGQVFNVQSDFRRETYRSAKSALGEPRLVKITSVTDADGNGVYEVALEDASGYVYIANGACAESTYVIHKRSGRYFRLGARVGGTGSTTWEMAPGHNLTDDDVAGWTSEEAWIIGRPFEGRDPANRGDSFQGYPMDIGLYSTFILLK